MKKITFYKSLEINSNSKNCILDGKKYKTLNGVWTFYVPKIQTKWFYSSNQKVACLREKHPQKLSDIDETVDYGVYSSKEWRAALSESIYTKAATNYVLIERLYKHGLGPKPLGFALAKNVASDTGKMDGWAVGVEVENIKKLKRKTDATKLELDTAGVVTDKINSALRQQIRGYVSDLNSVVSVRLETHDSRIEDLANMLKLSRTMLLTTT